VAEEPPVRERWSAGQLFIALGGISFVAFVVLIGATGGGLGPNPAGWFDGGTSLLLTLAAMVATVVFLLTGLRSTFSADLRSQVAEAGQLGLTYLGRDATPELSAMVRRLQPGREPRGARTETRISHLMAGSFRFDEVKVFDYWFEISSPSMSPVWSAFRVALVRTDAGHPTVLVRPRDERWSHSRGDRAPFGEPWGQEVDPGDEDVRARFEIRSDMPKEALAVLGPTVRALLIREFAGESLLIGEDVVLLMAPLKRWSSLRFLGSLVKGDLGDQWPPRRALLDGLIQLRNEVGGPRPRPG